ncbi:MAG TPA: hypothetical protein VK501_22655 [Baekduia sp.]|uniref:hypothetical protein n=1 Tax=Baekduia sp. TaxID=2600305 RepID=UPI002C2B1ACF|nr:hypothetical protein [Baekduia sp.]HMJ36724.1 hypothetical protein [Baekduia sp.]
MTMLADTAVASAVGADQETVRAGYSHVATGSSAKNRERPTTAVVPRRGESVARGVIDEGNAGLVAAPRTATMQSARLSGTELSAEQLVCRVCVAEMLRPAPIAAFGSTPLKDAANPE